MRNMSFLENTKPLLVSAQCPIKTLYTCPFNAIYIIKYHKMNRWEKEIWCFV